MNPQELENKKKEIQHSLKKARHYHELKMTALLLFVCLVFIVFVWSVNSAIQNKQRELAQNSQTATSTTREFVAPIISAESAIVYDPNTMAVLYSKNATTTRALASLTKLMTADIAYDFIQKNPEQTITISADALKTEGNSGLVLGEKWKLKDLVSFMLIESSNDAASAIAHSLMNYSDFLAEMNSRAKEIGSSLTFKDPAGLDDTDETVAGATGTVKDVVLLLSEILRHTPEVFNRTDLPMYTFTSESGIVHKAVNTNKALDNLPHLIGGKTGFTDLAGGNLAVIINAGLNKPMIIVVLGSTVDGRFKDTEALASSTLQYFSSL